MNEIERISDQLRRAFEGEAWHGPSVRELLRNVTADQAAARPIAAAHSIWEVTLHIAAWERVVRRRLEEWVSIEPTDEEDWPKVQDTSEESWKKTLEQLERGRRALGEAISGLDEARLSETVPGTRYSIYFMLHGLIQHDLYHAGQIAILKKSLVSPE